MNSFAKPLPSSNRRLMAHFATNVSLNITFDRALTTAQLELKEVDWWGKHRQKWLENGLASLKGGVFVLSVGRCPYRVSICAIAWLQVKPDVNVPISGLQASFASLGDRPISSTTHLYNLRRQQHRNLRPHLHVPVVEQLDRLGGALGNCN